MAGYFMYPFDWKKFDELLRPPATELTEKLIKAFKRAEERWRISTFSDDGASFSEALSALLSSEDWYSNLDYEDARKVDDLAESIFELSFRKKLRLHRFFKLDAKYNIYEKISWDLIALIWNGSLPQDEQEARSELTWSDVQSELSSNMENTYASKWKVPMFGHNPFRHPSFDYTRRRQETASLAAQDLESDTDHSSRVHIPMYGLHSPDVVERMLAMVEEVEPRLHNLAEYERGEFEVLCLTLAKTAEKGFGLYVAVDT